MMNSSETADSAMFPGGRSKFSRTCSLLSQYLKENGSFGDLTLGLAHNPEIKGAETNEAVNLLPAVAKSGFCDVKSEVETAQMTIFYGGKVVVFDGFPADKAKELVMLATKAAPPPPPAAASPAESTTAAHASLQADLHLPIARKYSLARFLEKRKDRIKANSPYQAAKPMAKGEAWMDFAPQFPLQMQRH